MAESGFGRSLVGPAPSGPSKRDYPAKHCPPQKQVEDCHTAMTGHATQTGDDKGQEVEREQRHEEQQIGHGLTIG